VLDAEGPVREGPAPHRCACVLVETYDNNVEIHCDVMVEDPDNPFCSNCEHRHVDQFTDVIVTSVPAEYYNQERKQDE